MNKAFALHCTLRGHEMDVRSVSRISNTNSILTASRDKTAKLFGEDPVSGTYTEQQNFIGHGNFVYCVKYLSGFLDHQDGFFLTGCADNVIRCFIPSQSTAVLEITGHANTVCALNVHRNGKIVSGSWDSTVKVWQLTKNENNLGFELLQTLKGHKQSVWDVLYIPESDTIISASADKTIKIWKSGKCVKTLTGHSDCVRGLALLPNCKQFLSCSNDATIKLWSLDGKCIHTYYGHKNFIYSVAAFQGGFVSSSEDRTVRVWDMEQTNPVQTLHLPSQSVWDVAVLHNGDIAAGCSDYTVRVFTRNPDRVAKQEDLMEFEQELSKVEITKDGNDISDIDISTLPGKDALEVAGTKDGETKMVHEDGITYAYNWSASESRWIQIGTVVGSASKGQKSMYNGKEYDYVFDVDIQEGMPALKLPYNLNEDTWFAAQRFIDDNELPQDYLDQISTFITDNTKGKQIGRNTAEQSGTYDPFTGSGRYVPGENGTDARDTTGDPFTSAGRYVPGQSNGDRLDGAQDPFTGSGAYTSGNADMTDLTLGGGAAADPMLNPSRYVPGGDEGFSLEEKPVASVPQNRYFPKEGFLKFDTASPKILQKIKEFSLQNNDLSLLAPEIIFLEDLTETSGMLTNEHFQCMWKVLKWPEALVLPALDLFRLGCVRHSSLLAVMCIETIDHDGPDQLLELLTGFIKAEGIEKHINNNRLMSLRILSNMFLVAEGAAFVSAGYTKIMDAINNANSENSSHFNGNKHIQIAVATLLVNFSVLINSSQNNTSTKVQHLNTVIHQFVMEVVIAHIIAFGDSMDHEALFRYLVCLGTLSVYPGGSKLAVNMGAIAVMDSINSIIEIPTKARDCCTLIAQCLSSSM